MSAHQVTSQSSQIHSEQGERAPLSQPLYGAGPVEAVGRMFRKALRFSGYASRSEFWWGFGFVSVFFAAITSLLDRLGQGTFFTDPLVSDSGLASLITIRSILGLLIWIAGLVLFLSLAARRLHDAGMSSVGILVGLIPVLGWIGLLIMLLLPSRPHMRCFEWDDIRGD